MPWIVAIVAAALLALPASAQAGFVPDSTLAKVNNRLVLADTSTAAAHTGINVGWRSRAGRPSCASPTSA